jgi:hypothetical protein
MFWKRKYSAGAGLVAFGARREVLREPAGDVGEQRVRRTAVPLVGERPRRHVAAPRRPCGRVVPTAQPPNPSRASPRLAELIERGSTRIVSCDRSVERDEVLATSRDCEQPLRAPRRPAWQR